MKSRALSAAALVLALVACRPGGPTQVEPSPEDGTKAKAPPPRVRVVSTGSTVLDEIFTVAAIFRNPRPRTIRDVLLKLSFQDAEGDELDSTGESLPYCPGSSDCWWAARFGATQFANWQDVITVQVEVKEEGPEVEGNFEVTEFEVNRNNEMDIEGISPGPEGIVYIVTSLGKAPKGGVSFNVRPDGGREIVVPDDVLPRLIQGETLRAFLYAFEIPSGA